MNLQMEINSLKQRISELEQQVEQEKDFPQYGKDYWYVDDDAEVTDSEWDGGDWDQVRMSVGNVFKTKEQAEFVVEKLKVEAELRKISRPFKCGEINHYIFLNTDNECLDVVGLSYSQYQGTIYFESEEKAQQAIQSVGEERIKKYIFEMEN